MGAHPLCRSGENLFLFKSYLLFPTGPKVFLRPAFKPKEKVGTSDPNTGCQKSSSPLKCLPGAQNHGLEAAGSLVLGKHQDPLSSRAAAAGGGMQPPGMWRRVSGLIPKQLYGPSLQPACVSPPVQNRKSSSVKGSMSYSLARSDLGAGILLS